jgi:hypothetical protein
MRKPACAANGWLVATTFLASTGIRCEVYGKLQSTARNYQPSIRERGILPRWHGNSQQ